jgi:MFS family permease
MYGRKPIMILGLFINSLSPLFLVLLQLNPYMSPFYYYSVGTLSGLVSWIGVALSTLSDVMPSHWRAPSYGLVLVGFSLGFAVAPQLAFLLGHWYVSLVSLGTIWFGIFILMFFVPETLAPNIAAEAKRVRQEQIEHQTSTATQRILYNVFYRPFWELSILNRNRLFRLLSCLAFFSGMVSSGE